MYRIGTSIKKSNQIRTTTTNVVVRNYCSDTSTTQSKEKPIKKKRSSREIFSEFVEDDEVVVDHRKVIEKKKVVDQQTQDFDKMLAGLTMKELKLMRYRDNPETFELFKREHFHINDAFNMTTTTKSLLEKQKKKQEQELSGSQFKTQRVIYDKYSQIKSQHIANELNKFKDQFEKPLVEAYNEVTNQSNLLYRTKRAEERLIKKKLEKQNKPLKMNSLERHYRDIVQVRNALDFRGKTILAGSDEEDAWQRILERSEISDPHSLSRLHMMDEYNDLGYQTEINEDYINQLSVVPFDFANPASYSSMVNLVDQLIAVGSHRAPGEITNTMIYEKINSINNFKGDSTKALSELEQEVKSDAKLFSMNYKIPPIVVDLLKLTPEQNQTLSKKELEELAILRLAAQRLEQYEKAKSNFDTTGDYGIKPKPNIENYKYYQQMNNPSVANAKSAKDLLYIGGISLNAGTRPSTVDEIIDLLPYDEEVVEDSVPIVDDEEIVPILDADLPPLPQDPFAIKSEYFNEKGDFLRDGEDKEIVIEQKASVQDGEVIIENVETVISTPVVETITPSPNDLTLEERFNQDHDSMATLEQKKKFLEVAYEPLFGSGPEVIDMDMEHEEDRIDAIEKYYNKQRELPMDDRDGIPDELIKRELPSRLPDLSLLSSKIRIAEENSLNMIANRFINEEVNEKTATEVLDQIYEAYKTNNLFNEDVIEHDKNTIREANGDVAIPDSMYFEYDTTFRDLVDRDVIFKMPLKDTDLVRVLTHQLSESGLLKQEKVLKYNADDMPASKKLVESRPDAFPDFVKEIIDQNPEESVNIVSTRYYDVAENLEHLNEIHNGSTEIEMNEDLYRFDRSQKVHDEIYDERRLYINLRPQIKDEGVISVPTIFKKRTETIVKDEVESNNGWLMGKPFDMLDYRLNGQPNKLPIDEEQQDNEEEIDEDEPAPIIEELVEEEDEDFRDLTPGVDQEPELFEQTDLYYYLQQGSNQEWFRPEKINDNDIALLERRQTWYPNQRQHIRTYPFQFISSHNTTDQTVHDNWVNRKAVLKVNVSAFNLPKTVENRLAELTANRYDPQKRVLTLVANNHKTLPENKYEVKRLFKELLHEANLADPNFVSVRSDNYQAPPPQSFVPSAAAKAQEKFNIYRLQGFPILSNQQKQHLELYSHIKSHLELNQY
ncbi:hypothetical protein RB653_004146 [Dictyostelium firmibasis]|uniref:Small ribosomal subunit protein mS35 mitochondrial conserved domain-containing protein n=1 Tax=Dictyostelium firmibasis TaxID=79012 RepID=A0AAN7YXR3_9MYCE